MWHIFALSFISGCGQAFGGPAYQSMIPSLVPRRDLPNAIALNSTQFNLSRVLGPVTGGIVLATIGTAACFALNGLSFFIVVIALASLHLPPHVLSPTHRAIGEELQDRPALRARQPADADAHDPRLREHVPRDADSHLAAVVRARSPDKETGTPQTGSRC